MLTVASEIPQEAPKDYTEFTKNATFKGLRLGVPRKVFFNPSTHLPEEMIDAINAAIHKISSLGAMVQDPADLPSANEFLKSQAEEVVYRTSSVLKISQIVTSFKVSIQSYLAELNSTPVRTLEDLINWNDAHANIEFMSGQCCQQVWLFR